jgi:hypothetical protein
MGTRSVVAIPHHDGWHGRYVHWDGYPSGVGAALHQIVTRDGHDHAVRTLTAEHFGWSSITGETDPELTMPGHSAARYTAVPGYGIAYTPAEQSDEWVRHDGSDWGTEWAYVLGPDTITVYCRRWNDGSKMVGAFGFGAEADQGHWELWSTVGYDQPWRDEADTDTGAA